MAHQQFCNERCNSAATSADLYSDRTSAWSKRRAAATMMRTALWASALAVATGFAPTSRRATSLRGSQRPTSLQMSAAPPPQVAPSAFTAVADRDFLVAVRRGDLATVQNLFTPERGLRADARGQRAGRLPPSPPPPPSRLRFAPPAAGPSRPVRAAPLSLPPPPYVA